MPRAKKNAGAPKMGAFRDEFISQATDLWDTHSAEIETILDESEDKKIGVSFKLDINTAESKAKVETRIRWSEVFTDERSSQMDDPAQGTFTDIVEEVKPKGKKKGKKDAPSETDINDDRYGLRG